MDKKSFNSFWSSKKVSERRDKTILFYSMDKSYKVRDIEKGLKNWVFFVADIESGPMSSYILKEHHIG